MSNTPRTDAAVEDMGRGFCVVPAKLARQLETELNEWKRLYESSEWESVLSQVLKDDLDEARRAIVAYKWRCNKLQDDYDTQAKLIQKAKL